MQKTFLVSMHFFSFSDVETDRHHKTTRRKC